MVIPLYLVFPIVLIRLLGTVIILAYVFKYRKKKFSGPISENNICKLFLLKDNKSLHSQNNQINLSESKIKSSKKNRKEKTISRYLNLSRNSWNKIQRNTQSSRNYWKIELETFNTSTSRISIRNSKKKDKLMNKSSP